MAGCSWSSVGLSAGRVVVAAAIAGAGSIEFDLEEGGATLQLLFHPAASRGLDVKRTAMVFGGDYVTWRYLTYVDLGTDWSPCLFCKRGGISGSSRSESPEDLQS